MQTNSLVKGLLYNGIQFIWGYLHRNPQLQFDSKLQFYKDKSVGLWPNQQRLSLNQAESGLVRSFGSDRVRFRLMASGCPPASSSCLLMCSLLDP